MLQIPGADYLLVHLSSFQIPLALSVNILKMRQIDAGVLTRGILILGCISARKIYLEPTFEIFQGIRIRRFGLPGFERTLGILSELRVRLAVSRNMSCFYCFGCLLVDCDAIKRDFFGSNFAQVPLRIIS